MAKLYIFGIGGTGSRVIESLTMMLAAGVNINATEIIPIIIDVDESNGNLGRTTSILDSYINIQNSGNNQSNFFKAKIKALYRTDGSNTGGYIYQFNGGGLVNPFDKSFNDFIDYSNLDDANKALANLLFSEENQLMNMRKGFKGNPNLGSVALNQFANSPCFDIFCNDFTTGDRIFIVSSIFGGTGAAGFPLILKNLRELHSQNPAPASANDISGSIVGAITYLPYFGLDVTGGVQNRAIDSATFISKTKAALKYYENSVNSSVNALYYIGDPDSFSGSRYEYSEGSNDQNNEAHFTELAGALSIIDFMQNNTLHTDANFKPLNPVAKEYALARNVHINDSINFNDMGTISKNSIAAPLTQMSLLSLYLNQHISSALSQPWATQGGEDSHIDTRFLGDSYYQDILTFCNLFTAWLKQMKNNKISFAPINITECDENNLFDKLVEGYRPHSGFMEKGTNFSRIDHLLNRRANNRSTGKNSTRFLSLFWDVTKEIVVDKYRMQ